MDQLFNLLKGFAPVLATAVAGPLGGAAVSMIAKKFGVEDSVAAVAQAITGDPEAGKKLRELDMEYAKLHLENVKDARAMNVKVQEAANASWLAKNTAYALDIGIVTATIFLAWFAFMKDVPEANKELVYMALGSLITMSGTILNFHRGSSQGSKDKGSEIQKFKDNQ